MKQNKVVDRQSIRLSETGFYIIKIETKDEAFEVKVVVD